MSIRANVDARALDERISFDRAVTEQTDTGDPVVEWTELVTCWARVDGANARRVQLEPYVNSGLRSVSDYTVWIRADVFKRFDITVVDRIRWGNKVMDIADIPDQGLRGRLIAIIARTGLNEG